MPLVHLESNCGFVANHKFDMLAKSAPHFDYDLPNWDPPQGLALRGSQ